MDRDFVFIDHDGSREEGTLSRPNVPVPGDAIIHKNKSYEIVSVTARRINQKPLVIAVEFWR